MVELAWWHYSCSLFNSVSIFFSNLLITDSYAGFCSMAFVSVISFHHFILPISLKISDLFNNLWWLMFFIPFFCVFSMFQFPWHNLISSQNSVIWLFFRTIIYVWGFRKRRFYLFNLFSYAAVSFFTWARFVLSFIYFFK